MSIVLIIWSLSSSAVFAPTVEPRNEPKAATAAARRLTAPFRQNLKTARVVPQELENLLHPSAKCAGMPVKI